MSSIMWRSVDSFSLWPLHCLYPIDSQNVTSYHCNMQQSVAFKVLPRNRVFAAYSSHFIPVEKDNSTHWIAGWAALEPGQGMELKRKFLAESGD